MFETWLPLIVTATAILAAGWYLLNRTPKPLLELSPREERLARKLALAVGCSVVQALPAVRREIDIAPGQSDETLFKRAAYHYRQDLPETACSVYRDPKPG